MSAAGVLLAARGVSEGSVLASPAFPVNPFQLGVASGDPLSGGVVLWTRLAPAPLAEDGQGGMPVRSIPVKWEVAEDEGFRRIVRRGTKVATPELAHSVHAEVKGLRPFREYFYRFKAGDVLSPTGRTKTAPAPGSSVDRLTFALGSCQSWVGGRYASYRDMAQQDLDLMVHVGDYIYERPDTRSLSDFRDPHFQYKTSPDLQAAHAAFPFVVTFDDHEVDNNWADEVPQDDTPNFIELRANAFQAYYEHMPLRVELSPSARTCSCTASSPTGGSPSSAFSTHVNTATTSSAALGAPTSRRSSIPNAA
jgi:phosphodiesterase/alkaline phosphatase D-like protein